jgi:hypothetical protein
LQFKLCNGLFARSTFDGQFGCSYGERLTCEVLPYGRDGDISNKPPLKEDWLTEKTIGYEVEAL